MVSISIAIPSYNRGSTCLNSVKKMREELSDEVQIVVVNNGTEEKNQFNYRLLAGLSNVKYIEVPEKLGFYGSFCRALDEADGEAVVVTSDEDTIPQSAIDAINDTDWSQTAILRGSVSGGYGNATKQRDLVLQKGLTALTYYGFGNAYTSGVVYNKALMKPAIELLKSPNGEKHKWYPHLYLDLLGCVLGDVKLVAAPTAVEGPPDPEGDNKVSQYNTQYSYGSRLDQHVILRDGLFDALALGELPLSSFRAPYLTLCGRTMRLIGYVNHPQYAEAGMNSMRLRWLSQEFAYVCIQDLEAMKPYLEDIKSDLTNLK
jgi:glycosyltransferase involved in cell wall biosynthesis